MKINELTSGGLFSDGDWVESKDQDPNGGVRLIQLADIGDTNFIDKSKRFMNKATADRLRCTFINKNDILVARMPDPIGRCCLFPFDEQEKYVTVVDVCIIRPGKGVDNKYLMYAINSPVIRHQISSQVTGTTRQRITRKKIGELEIPLPPLPIQKKIAAILDAADAHRQKTKALLDKYDQLAQSIFLEMFGDPVKNEKGWEFISLQDHGDFKNGLNFKRNEIGINVKYIGVGDFKNLYKIDHIEHLSKVSLTELPSQNYFLRNGDLLLVRSNGNRNLVGRCVVIHSNDVPVTFSGFCIRYRINDKRLSPLFLSFLFRNKSFRSYMLAGGKGANIQNINQKMLNDLKVINPDFEIQNKFAAVINQIEYQKKLSKKSILQCSCLFQSLLQRAFKGELV